MNLAALLNMTDEELVRLLDDKRRYSPIIEDLCRRLEAYIDMPDCPTVHTGKEDCPVCLASLRVTVDTEAGITSLAPL